MVLQEVTGTDAGDEGCVPRTVDGSCAQEPCDLTTLKPKTFTPCQEVAGADATTRAAHGRFGAACKSLVTPKP